MRAYTSIAEESHKQTDDGNVQLCELDRCVPRADSNLLDSQLIGHAPVVRHIVFSYVTYGATEFTKVFAVQQLSTSAVYDFVYARRMQ